MTRQTSGFAIASLVLGLLALPTVIVLIGSILAVLGIIFGHLARAHIKRSPETLAGGGMALAGLICSYLALLGTVLLVIAVTVPNFVQARRRAQELQQAYEAKARTAETPSPAALNPKESPSQAYRYVKGTEFSYTLQIPNEWSVKRKEADYDILCIRRSLYVGVIAEESQLPSRDLADIVRQNLLDKATDVRWTQPEPLLIDRRQWLGFVVNCRIEGLLAGYQFYVHSGANGTYQIVGWTTQDLFDRDLNEMRKVMQTFRFPSPGSSRSNAPQAKESNAPVEDLSNSAIWNAVKQSVPRSVEVLRVNREEVQGKTVISVEAKDSGIHRPGDGITPFKEALAKSPYLTNSLGPLNALLTQLSALQTSSNGANYVLFTLQCYPLREISEQELRSSY